MKIVYVENYFNPIASISRMSCNAVHKNQWFGLLIKYRRFLH